MKYTLLIAGASAISLRESKPLIHPQTGLAITTTGQHWYGQPPLAMSEMEKPLIHPQTGLAITTTGQHWYGQPPLAMSQVPPVVPDNIWDPNTPNPSPPPISRYS